VYNQLELLNKIVNDWFDESNRRTVLKIAVFTSLPQKEGCVEMLISIRSIEHDEQINYDIFDNGLQLCNSTRDS
jgi:hypothetical protein